MGNLNHCRPIPGAALLLSPLLLFLLVGCTSIHSKAVRNLIDIETEKIVQANKNAGDFTKNTDRAINEWKKGVQELSKALQNQRTVESVHTLVFSSNQNIATKTGVDAHAAGYLIGELYLKDRIGLEQTVLDQFDEDYETLRMLAKQTRDSWATLEKTHKQIDAFADRSSLATVDADLARALIVEFAGNTEAINKVLQRSRQVNEVLKKASGVNLLTSLDVAGARLLTEDVINLLERIRE